MFRGSGVISTNVNRRISVLHFTTSTARGGAEEHMLALLKGFDRQRFRPMMAAHPELIELLGPDLPGDVEVFPVVLDSPRNLGGAVRFARLVRDQRVDIVHSHMFQSSRLASPIARLAGVPVTIETPHVRESWRHGWIKGSYVIDRMVGRFVTTYIAVSAANAGYLSNEKQLPLDKIITIRPGTSLDRFHPDRKAPPGLAGSLNIEEDAPIVLVLARLEPQKGHRILLDAWKSVTAAFPAARLVCLSDGSLREQLQAQVAALGIGSSVHFIGYQPEAADWVALAAFTVLPSFYEGLPGAAIESLAGGRAVVATLVDGTTEIVLSGKTGLLVPPGEPAPLSSAICRLLASPELARSLGRAGRRLVEEHFSERRHVMENEAVYERALRRTNRVRSGIEMSSEGTLAS
jgi:glycosyltransferase involved in cell wall biosynthesis